MKRYRHIKLILLASLLAGSISAQETVFSGLGSNLKRADKYYGNQSYRDAYELYLEVEKKGRAGNEVYLKLARTCHQLYHPGQAVLWYEKYLDNNNTLDPEDAYMYAESLTSQGQYRKAITWLKEYQRFNKSNTDITQKIWRLQNIHHLYSDSSYFEVNPLSINTEYAEFGACYLDQALLFVSNRSDKGGISTIDRVTGQPLQSIYMVNFVLDSINDRVSFEKPQEFLKEQGKGFHMGAASVSGDKLIYTRSTFDRESGKSVLKLYWVERENSQWKGESPFTYNTPYYSLSYPSLSQDAQTLYFVSDMPGGKGGNDIYVCIWTENGWSEPQNMGEPINTTGDETSPFIHQDNMLYFASNGHGGFGGLDIFKVSVAKDHPSEVENMGYPVNSSDDDFGFILNQSGVHGFMASNREAGGFNDDLYEVIVDLQSYPLVISGSVRYSDPDWSESGRLEILPSAKLTLVDNLRNIPVFETTTDSEGQFSLEIPYSSKYKLKVGHEKVGEPTVSLEIPRNRKLYKNHEIVVVKEKFKDYADEQAPEVLNNTSSTTGEKQKKRIRELE